MKEKLEKAKAWTKENWGYVVSAGGVVGLALYAVYSFKGMIENERIITDAINAYNSEVEASETQQLRTILEAVGTVGQKALEDHKYTNEELNEILKDVDGLDEVMKSIS